MFSYTPAYTSLGSKSVNPVNSLIVSRSDFAMICGVVTSNALRSFLAYLDSFFEILPIEIVSHCTLDSVNWVSYQQPCLAKYPIFEISYN